MNNKIFNLGDRIRYNKQVGTVTLLHPKGFWFVIWDGGEVEPFYNSIAKEAFNLTTRR